MPGRPAEEIALNLADIRTLNRWFGGCGVAAHAVAGVRYTSPVSLLDIATGSGDIALAMQKCLQRRGAEVNIVGLDTNPDVLAEAERHCRGSVSFVQGDARALPFPSESFDIVTCTLALHHFDEPEAVQVLREMWRVARQAVIVIDLWRSLPALWGTWLATHLVSRSGMTRHDGPLSVRRAYTVEEAKQLALAADWQNASIRRRSMFRYVLQGNKGDE